MILRKYNVTVYEQKGSHIADYEVVGFSKEDAESKIAKLYKGHETSKY